MADVVVAIDGPAGSGKSSVSKEVARRLGYSYLDTGAVYRSLAWYVLEAENVPDEAAILAAVRDESMIDVSIDPEHTWVRVGSTDVTAPIREPRIGAAVSAVARVPETRAALNERFRAVIRDAATPGIVVEGRDITTVTAPDADVRILLTAAEDVRIARRSADVAGESAASVGENLSNRDRADSAVVDFLTAADGVTTIDSTDLDFAATVDRVIEAIRAGTALHGHDPKETTHG